MAFFDDVRAETGSGTAAPTPAERVRTILATAGSLTLETDGFRCDLVGLHTTAPGPGGRLLRLRPPAESALAARVLCAPAGDLPVRLHLTDIAPVGVRDRVRARVTLTGWLAPETGRSEGAQAGGEQADADRLVLGFDPAEALVAAGAGAGAGDVAVVDPEELTAAGPDPLAVQEPAMLLHLADSHRDAVDALTRLLDPAVLHGVVRVHPLALDRYGLVLRLEHPRTHRDVRLPFPNPLTDPAEAGPAIQTLLSAAHHCPRRRPHRGG
ncbi:DUF2470 domain-containing protein [Streptomyces sp. WAC 06738]|uniref:DUF2470 domain-containing protein n=1 Tax=Streptomyces sp. WAC 06738 TaxID=2203210 RepID=UPI000F6E03E2|nr:DUF2470 domain-containing protein [Streptomyces sp. WAC 06738]AZM47364.1 DUF2470 domain-containing protein [Streptomyces sp. WAC 06738]